MTMTHRFSLAGTAILIGSFCLFSFYPSSTRGDLIGYWNADGNFADSSGNGNHGSGFGNTSFVNGIHGQAFDFDGSGDYISVAHSNDFNFGTGDFSVTFWVNFDIISSNGSGIIDKDAFSDPSTSQFEGWLFNSCDGCGGVGWETRDVPGLQRHNRYERSNFAPGTWYNFTSTRENNALRLYIDGILVEEVAEAAATNVNNSVDLIIGALRPSGSSAQFLDGQVDDVAVFNHALSQNEVTTIFNFGVTAVPEPSSLVALGLAALFIFQRRKRVAAAGAA
jgi:hypothetical protein